MAAPKKGGDKDEPAKGMNFREFRQRFQTEETCASYLFEQRWLDGFICPKCGGRGCYRLRGRREYVCKHCHRQSSITVGTVLHRTYLPLTVWFWAICLVARDKRVRLSRELEISYSGAWYLLHCLRRAMGAKRSRLRPFRYRRIGRCLLRRTQIKREAGPWNGKNQRVDCGVPHQAGASPLHQYRFLNWTLNQWAPSSSVPFVLAVRSTATPLGLSVSCCARTTFTTTRSLTETAVLCVGYMS